MHKLKGNKPIYLLNKIQDTQILYTNKDNTFDKFTLQNIMYHILKSTNRSNTNIQQNIYQQNIQPQNIQPQNIQPRNIQPRNIQKTLTVHNPSISTKINHNGSTSNINKTNHIITTHNHYDVIDNDTISNNTAYSHLTHSKYDSKFYTIVNNDKIKQLFEKSLTIYIKYVDSIYFGFCCTIYPEFLYLKDTQKLIFMKQLKYKMGLDLTKLDLYKKLKYKNKKVKKTFFQNDLLENELNINKLFYRYLGDYFDINFITFNNKDIIYYNDFNKQRYSVCLYNINENIHVYININGHSFLDYNAFSNIIFDMKNSKPLKPKIKLNNINLNKYKLKELQDLALQYNLNIKKKGVKKYINKTKHELTIELQNIH